MAIELKETVGYANFKIVNDNSSKINLAESACATVPQQMISPDSLMVEIEGIHSEILTVNDTFYTAECLKKSIPYWTSPYERPVIMHHKDQDGVIIGRIKGTEMVKSEKSRSNTPALSFTCNIGDDGGIKGVNNGTLSTVSIGAMVYDLRCSICNKNLAEEGPCEHEKGEYYDDKLCYWIIEDMMPKELSYVIVPSDKYAQTMKVYRPSKKQIKESVEVNNEMSIYDELIKGITESVIEDDSENKASVAEAEEASEAAKVMDEEVKDKEEKEPKKEDDKEEKDDKEEEKEEPKQEEEKPEEKEDEKEEEKKEDKDDKKEEEDSNKDDEDKKIKELEAKVADLIKEVNDLKAKLQKAKEAKESVELELAKYKVQEKVEVASRIKSLKESVGISCEESEEMAKNYSIDELNLIYTNLKDVCAHTQQLPTKITQESLVDDAADNTSKKVKDVKESVDYEEDYSDFIEFQNLRNKLFK